MFCCISNTTTARRKHIGELSIICLRFFKRTPGLCPETPQERLVVWAGRVQWYVADNKCIANFRVSSPECVEDHLMVRVFHGVVVVDDGNVAPMMHAKEAEKHLHYLVVVHRRKA